MKHLTKLSLIFYILAVYHQSYANPQDTLSNSNQIKGITIASEPDYPPYCIVNAQGKAEGFSIDLFLASAKATGIEVDIKIGIWNQIKQDLVDGKIDALPLVGKTPEREEVYDFTMPYIRLHGAIFTKTSFKKIQQVSDLKQYLVAVMKGDNAEEYIKRTKLTDKLVTTHTFEDAFKLLNDGKVDAVVIQRVVGIELVKKMGYKNIAPIELQLHDFRQDFCFAVKKGNTILLNRLNEGLSIIIANGTYDEIHLKWFGPIIKEKISIRDILSIGIKMIVPMVILFSFILIVLLSRIVKARTRSLQIEVEKHRATNQILHNQQILLEKMEKDSLVGGWDYDVKQKKVAWTKGVYMIHGLLPEEFDPSDKDIDIMFYQPNDKKLLDKLFQLLIEEGKPYEVELKLIDAKGIEKWVWTSGQAEYLDSKIVRVFGSIMDITEIKNTNEKLKESENKLRSIIEHAIDVFYSHDINYKIHYISPQVKKVLGYEVEEALILWTDFLSNNPINQIGITKTQEAIETGSEQKPYELEFVHKNGTMVWVEVREAPIIENGNTVAIVGSLTDITQRKKTEEELRKSKKFLSDLIENSGALIYAKSKSGQYELINKRWEEVTGLSRSITIGRTDEELFPGEVGKQFHANDVEVLETGEMVEKEEFLDTNSGKRYFLSIKFPIYYDQKEVSGICGISTEITEIKKTSDELHAIKHKLEQLVEERTKALAEKVDKLDKSQKAMLYMVEDMNNMTEDLKRERKKLEISNKELEAFSYSVSHDLRAPLRAIDGFSRILIEDYSQSLDDEGNRLLEIIRQNSQKMDKLITDLLALSRVTRNEMNLSRIDMASMANSMFYEVVDKSKSESIDFRVEQLPNVYADTTLMRQVWQNLIGNALKYSKSNEKTRIVIEGKEEENEFIYCVKDNGVGFNQEYAHKIFETFQRLHRSDEFEGTGIGLSIVQRIVHRHGGRVWAHGKEGEGATFWFSLPKMS